MTIHPYVKEGLTVIERTSQRSDTLIQVLMVTRWENSNLYHQGCAKRMVHLTDSFGLQAVMVKAFNRIQESNVTKAFTSENAAETMARKLWEKGGTITRYSSNEGKIFLVRQSDEKS